MRKLSIIITMICAVVNLQAQDLKEDLAKARKQFSELTTLYMEMHVKGYKGAMTNSPEFHNLTKIHRDGDRYYYEMKDQEVLINESYMTMVDKQNKQVVCTPRTGKAPGKLQDPGLQIDEVLAGFEESKYMGLKNGLKHYRTTSSDKMVVQNDIYIDAKTNLPVKLVYTYNRELYAEGYWVETRFTKINRKPTFNADTFDENKYIKVLKDGWQLQPKYQDYNLNMVADEF